MMPLSNAFVSPAKGNQPRTKLHHMNKPCTYSAITKNLLKSFCQTDPVIKTLTIKLESFPDFMKLPFPPGLSQAQKDKIVHNSLIMLTANLATNIAKSSSPKVSFHDIEMQHTKDIMLINGLIKDTVDSFLQGLFQFRHACAQLHGWTSTTYLVMHKAANSDVDSSDDDDDDDANKWSTTNIDFSMTLRSSVCCR